MPVRHQSLHGGGEQPGVQCWISVGRPFAGRDARPDKAIDLIVGPGVGDPDSDTEAGW